MTGSTDTCCNFFQKMAKKLQVSVDPVVVNFFEMDLIQHLESLHLIQHLESFDSIIFMTGIHGNLAICQYMGKSFQGPIIRGFHSLHYKNCTFSGLVHHDVLRQKILLLTKYILFKLFKFPVFHVNASVTQWQSLCLVCQGLQVRILVTADIFSLFYTYY